MAKDSEKEEKKTVSNTSENEISGENKVVIPDGGWGWMVVFGSFMIHVIADGITYSLGIFYSEWVQYFRSSKGTTAWVGSLVPATTYLVGKYKTFSVNSFHYLLPNLSIFRHLNFGIIIGIHFFAVLIPILL